LKKIESGKRRTFWLPHKLDSKAEEVRQRLGLSRSTFYRYAVIKLVEESNIKHSEGEIG
jgi:ACT domain-containing protein